MSTAEMIQMMQQEYAKGMKDEEMKTNTHVFVESIGNGVYQNDTEPDTSISVIMTAAI